MTATATRRTQRSRDERWPGPAYHVTADFQAPLPFVFRWCTDYQPEDNRLEKEEYARKIIERTSTRIVYEDLFEADDGWRWARHVVTLHPPDRWHSESVGNYRTATLDYVLAELANGKTHLDLRWRRRPTALPRKTPSKAEIERSSTTGWRNYGKALERDYRRSVRSKRTHRAP